MVTQMLKFKQYRENVRYTTLWGDWKVIIPEIRELNKYFLEAQRVQNFPEVWSSLWCARPALVDRGQWPGEPEKSFLSSTSVIDKNHVKYSQNVCNIWLFFHQWNLLSIFSLNECQIS